MRCSIQFISIDSDIPVKIRWFFHFLLLLLPNKIKSYFTFVEIAMSNVKSEHKYNYCYRLDKARLCGYDKVHVVKTRIASLQVKTKNKYTMKPHGFRLFLFSVCLSLTHSLTHSLLFTKECVRVCAHWNKQRLFHVCLLLTLNSNWFLFKLHDKIQMRCYLSLFRSGVCALCCVGMPVCV